MLFGCFFCFFRASARIFWGVNFKGIPHQNGEFPLCSGGWLTHGRRWGAAQPPATSPPRCLALKPRSGAVVRAVMQRRAAARAFVLVGPPTLGTLQGRDCIPPTSHDERRDARRPHDTTHTTTPQKRARAQTARNRQNTKRERKKKRGNRGALRRGGGAPPSTTNNIKTS